MKQIAFVILLLMILAFSLLGQTKNNPAPKLDTIEQDLIGIESARRQAIKEGDFSALGKIYAEDFTGIVGSGQVINREQLFAVFKQTDPRVAFATDEIKVRVFGETAIFTGRLIGKTSAGEVVSASRFTHFFVRREGRWQCVMGQSTAIAKT